MLGNTAYAIANKKITGVASGFDHALRTGDNTFSVFFIDGSKVDLTIPLPANGVNGTDGQDGQDGVSVTGYTLLDDTHLVWDFSDGTQSSQMEIPEQIVNISQEIGNALVQKADGLFVGATGVEISSETDNAIEEKADGLYVKKTTDAAISQESGNALVKKEDGLYVGSSAVEISEEEGNAIEQKEDGLYVSDVSGVEIVETGETVSGDANFWVDENEDTEVVGTIATKEYCDSFIQAIKDITGDVADFTRADWTNLVQAVNYTYGAGAASFNYDNTDKKLVITTRSGQTVNVNLSSIITDTKIEDLKDVNVNAVENGQLLGYHAASQTWKNVTINLSQVLNDAKDYTDMKFQAIEHADAIAVDEKPVDEGSKIVYVKDGVTKETTNYNTWFYYTADEKTVQTIFVDGMEFTLDVAGGVDFSDYVTQTQITSTMQDVDKTKVPNLTALYEVHTNVTSELGKKLDKAQGNVNAGKVLQVGSDGNVCFADIDTLVIDVNEHISTVEQDMQFLGWCVPEDSPIHNTIDTNGNFIQKVGRVCFDNLTFNRSQESKGWSFQSDSIVNYVKKVSTGDDVTNMYCITYQSVSRNTQYSHTIDKVIAINSEGKIYVNDNSVESSSDFKTKMKDTYLYYELATYKTIKVGNEKVELLMEHLTSVDVNEKGLELFGYIAPKLSDTVKDYIDENGVYHKKVGRKKLSEFDYEFIWNDSNKAFGSNSKINNFKNGSSIICGDYTTYKSASELRNVSTNGISTSTDGYIQIRDNAYINSTVVAFKSSLVNKYLYYELETEVTKSIYSDNVLDGINSSLGTVTNMLKSTLQSSVVDTVTCTKNNDGTYTLKTSNPTTTAVGFTLGTIDVKKGKVYKIVGCPKGGGESKYRLWTISSTAFPLGHRLQDTGDGTVMTALADETVRVIIEIGANQSFSNLVFKPMISTNLNATYNDFVAYTGSTGKLTSDVAELQSTINSSLAPLKKHVFTEQFNWRDYNTISSALSANISIFYENGTYVLSAATNGGYPWILIVNRVNQNFSAIVQCHDLVPVAIRSGDTGATWSQLTKTDYSGKL